MGEQGVSLFSDAQLSSPLPPLFLPLPLRTNLTDAVVYSFLLSFFSFFPLSRMILPKRIYLKSLDGKERNAFFFSLSPPSAVLLHRLSKPLK